MLNENEKPIRVAFYLRVSTEDQVRGFGIDMQRSSFDSVLKFKSEQSNWVHKKEWEFVDEACSGGNLDRPQFKKMIKVIEKEEIDLVVVYKIDRISRNLTHLLNVFQKFQNHNVSIYSIKENIDFSNSIGRLAFHMFGALAEFERDTIKMRTLDGIIASARQGNYVGGNIPLGYKKVDNLGKKGSTLIIVPEEAKIVRQLFDWFVFDRKNYEQIRNLFNELKTSKGVSYNGKNPSASWHENTIKDMLSNPIYVGSRYKKIKTENGKEESIQIRVPAIIDEIVFRQAQYYIEETSMTKGKKGGGYNSYLLSRKLIYKYSGNKFVGYQRSKGGFAYRHKKTSKDGIDYHSVEITADAIEDFVLTRIKEVINKPKEFFYIYEKQTKKSNDLDLLKNEQEDLRNVISLEGNKIIKVSDDYYSGLIEVERKEKLIDLYNQRIESANKRYYELEEEIKKVVYIEIAKERIKKFSEAYKKTLGKLDKSTLQAMVDTLVDSILVWEDGSDIRIKVNFRFAKDSDTETGKGFEPKNLENTIKKEESDDTSFSNGGQ